MPHTGFDRLLRLQLKWATQEYLRIIFDDFTPRNEHTPDLTTRNQHIQMRFDRGEGSDELAKEYSISRQRIYQIVHGQ